MRVRKDLMILSIMAMLLSFFIVKCFDNQRIGYDIGVTTSVYKIQELMSQLKALQETNRELKEDLRQKEAVLNNYENEATERIYRGEEIRKQLEQARILAGLTDLEGPGIEIILNDRKKDTIMLDEPYSISDFIVHDIDLLEVVNELKAAGAEAIAINGARILATSRISCGGPTITVGAGQRFAPPFIIHAIGDPDALANYFERPDSIYHILTFYGLEFSIKKLNNVKIPRYYGEVNFSYARPVEGGE
ncbi:DUF881 domain-containing protein [Caldicoprobacter faecalis]|uniref:Uncharacterized conserved protein YlxW, UPF0749 family n=1 Tax=Caldicoprobacter faecalis TaxID=937334 RepID=A0A1I5XMD4_9FIRM|nr:DUF881 domain-containing protein [Caldicoprobacter faecalis]SFQ33070.1 Uncharacterized conserved protein YlxW, UPF0749 family [Caldicoprobacter faecalis]